jgi:hypothetical protein
VIEAALDNQSINHYLLQKSLRRDSWQKGDYLCANSKKSFGSIMKKVFPPEKLPRA